MSKLKCLYSLIINGWHNELPPTSLNKWRMGVRVSDFLTMAK